MIEPPVLETERLILRANRLEDFEAYAAFYQTDRATLRGGQRGRLEAWRAFCAEIGHWQMRGYGFWAIEEKATGRYAGQVGLYHPEGWPEEEIGWLLMEGFEGRGLAMEAAIAARAHAYGTLGWPTAVSIIHEQNHRSIALALRMGCRHDGVCQPGDMPLQIYRHPSPQELA
ncbi:MAG: GNAT family N-acetyltransferase [Rhodobacteraceae bacterium]|nr:GNAT family N-acetyltransferase [Paracoccaceae bacterium]